MGFLGRFTHAEAPFMDFYVYSFSPRVLAVASVNRGKNQEFAVYIDAVPGESFDREFYSVATNGTKMPVAIARLLFPDLFETHRWRS